VRTAFTEAALLWAGTYLVWKGKEDVGGSCSDSGPYVWEVYAMRILPAGTIIVNPEEGASRQ